MKRPQPTSFTDRHAAVGALSRHWLLDKAYYAAEKLVGDFPTEPDAYVMFNLLICLTDNAGGRAGGLRYASPGLIQRACSSIPSFRKSTAHGDMLRDQLFGLARFGRLPGYREAAAPLPDQIELLHADDSNRLACLTDGRARLVAAQGNLLDAYDLHQQAEADWALLPPGEADPNWVHFHRVHWLRVCIELWGRHARQTQKVMRLLNGEKPEGAHGDLQIRIIRTPVVGLRFYNWLETHRMTRP
jgi:hypothetical protein